MAPANQGISGLETRSSREPDLFPLFLTEKSNQEKSPEPMYKNAARGTGSMELSRDLDNGAEAPNSKAASNA
jgi:hypothetical protein